MAFIVSVFSFLGTLILNVHAQQCADDCFSAAKAYDIDSAFSRPWGCSYLMTTKITHPVVTETRIHPSTNVFQTHHTTVDEYWHLSGKDVRNFKRNAKPPASSSSPFDDDSTTFQIDARRAEPSCPAPMPPPIMSVPAYASQCVSNDAYSSACSCLGFHATTTMIPPCTRTVHSRNRVDMAMTITATRTIDVSPPACKTPSFFHLKAYVRGTYVGVLMVDDTDAPRLLPDHGPAGRQPAIFSIGFNRHLQHGNAQAVVGSFDHMAQITFESRDSMLDSTSIFALTCLIGPGCSDFLQCHAGKPTRNLMSLCASPKEGLYIGEETRGCAPVKLQMFNVSSGNLEPSLLSSVLGTG